MEFFSSNDINENKLFGNSICHFEIKKEEIENQNFKRIDTFMDKLTSYGSLARQKVLFSFADYDDDKRELIYVPEAVQYAKILVKNHPYFWYYAIQYNSAFFYLAFFVNDKNMTIATIPEAQKFFIKQDVEDLERFIKVMAMNLNIFGEEIGDIDGALECMKLWGSMIIGKKL